MTETPFQPRMDEYADLLATTHADEARFNLLIHLQQTYGNKYVQRFIESIVVQPKLTVNSPNDIYKQEADRVAEVVTGAIGPQAQRQPEKEEEELQAKPLLIQRTTINEVPEVDSEMEGKINAARGFGEPIDDSIREPMEQAFGADFSEVRVHTDTDADALSKSLQAHAFTTKHDIFFRSGEYDPKTPRGQKLLAHELTHTQQQGASERIAPWWPLGHRVITNKVFADTDYLGAAYQDDAKKYLEARSPDMDFVQDEMNAMEKGRNESKSVIKDYMKLMKKKNPTTEDKAKAAKMWDDNQLHKRPEWYMMHHGEGGLYREEASVAAARNIAMTESLVKLAADLYKAGKRESGLSVLSDALHQAEDRGSHQEGEMFKGHDIRRTIPPKFVSEEAGWQPQPGYQSNRDCDNAKENPEGAAQALYYAKEALDNFLGKIAGFAAEVTLKNPEEGQPSPSQRHSKMGGIASVTSTDWRTPLKGQSKSGRIRGIKAEKWQQAEQPKGGLIFEEEPARREELVKQAEHNYKIELLTSELTEQIREKAYRAWKNDDKVLGDEDLSRIGQAYIYPIITKIYPQFIDYFEPEEITQIVQRAVEQYKYQWSELYEGAKPAEVLRKEEREDQTN